METIKASTRERVAAGLSKGHGNAKKSFSEWLADLLEDAEVAAIREDIDAAVAKTLQRTFNPIGQAESVSESVSHVVCWLVSLFVCLFVSQLVKKLIN